MTNELQQLLLKYDNIYLNLKGKQIDTLHPIVRGNFKEIINFCKKNNKNIYYLNGGKGHFYGSGKETFLNKIKKFITDTINFFLPTFSKIKVDKNNSLIITSNHFLFTNSDYVTFYEWVNAVSGFKSQFLHLSPFLKFFTKLFVRDKNLKYLITSTNVAKESFKYYLGEKFFKKYKNKFIVEPPKLLLDKEYLNRLKEKREMELSRQNYKSFLFIGKDFIRKGGIETLIAIYDLYNEGKINKNTHRFTFITEKNKIPNSVFNKYQELINKGIIQHYEPLFKLDEIYEKIYTTHKSFVLLTRGETYGMVFLEAEAFDMEIITTNQGPIKEILDNYYNVKYINFIDKKYNWLNDKYIPKINVRKIIYNLKPILNIKQIKNAIY